MTSAKQKKMLEAERLFNKADQYDEKGDFKNAFKFFLAAARLGDTGCQSNLGNYYSWGRGVRKDPDKGVYWYKKAYKNGNGTGAFNLAMHRKKEGNLRSAVIWFKKIIANDGDACVELAKIYIGRKGGQKTAANLLKRALRMNERLMSGGGKEEAESLLKEISKVKKR
jgi:TPR repeat protein